MYTVYAEMYGWHVGINTCALYMYMYTNIIGAVYQFKNFIYSAHVESICVKVILFMAVQKRVGLN